MGRPTRNLGETMKIRQTVEIDEKLLSALAKKRQKKDFLIAAVQPVGDSMRKTVQAIAKLYPTICKSFISVNYEIETDSGSSSGSFGVAFTCRGEGGWKKSRVPKQIR